MAVPGQTLTLPDGRTLEYALYGDTSAATAATAAGGDGGAASSKPTIFHFHGFPGSHHEAAIFSAAAASCGVRIVAVTRPGMGLSTFDPARTLLSWPADVAAVADHLGVARFAVLGVSGGGPYALACWHALPGRVAGCALVCSLFPTFLGTQGMLLQVRAVLFLGVWATGLLGVLMGLGASQPPPSQQAESGAAGGGGEGGGEPGALVSAVDRAINRRRPDADRRVLEDRSNRELLERSMHGALQQGGKGAALDAKLYGTPWGFELAEVEVRRADGRERIVLWHGELDVNVPVAMAKKAAALMEGVDARFLPDEGHFSIVSHKADEAVTTLLEMLK